MHKALEPPRPPRIPTHLITHGRTRVDHYHWMRDRENPDVLAHLEAENQYTDAVLAHTKRLRDRLYEEIVGRLKPDDESVPYRLGDYYYYSRFEPEAEYPVYARKRRMLEADEEVMLDVNQLAEGHEFFALGEVHVSSGQDLLAFATDNLGRRIYDLRFKDLGSGELRPDVITGTTGNMAWANDNRTVFYSVLDPDTLRSHRIYRHELGTDPAGDELVFDEADETFSTYVWKSKSRRFVFIVSRQTHSTEYRYLDAADPRGTFELVFPRQQNHEYDVDHSGASFYLRTNLEADNFRVVRAPLGSSTPDTWQDVVPHRPNVLIERFELFSEYLAVQERRDGLVRLHVLKWGEGSGYDLLFDEPAYLASLGINAELDSTVLRYRYTSMTTPVTTYDFDMEMRTSILLKREEVLGGFEREDYATERLHAVAPDGTHIPISLVYRADSKRDWPAPLVLYGYGSYGISMDATFSAARLSLLDRGFTFAIAHVRGGEELGRRWYEHGKLLHKKNTFSDFIACAEHLVAAGYTKPDRLCAIGGSAGGLLVGAVINMRPDLFAGVVAQVPFVDIVTTMLDETIPLTTSEYDQWGDPREEKFFEYMLSYSPYDNVVAQDYPAVLALTGLHDSQVQFWEPAKWIAKLRTMKTDDAPVLLKTNLHAGHGGASGRFRQYEETSLMYAFLLDVVGRAPGA
jgi:oligopeptidase B